MSAKPEGRCAVDADGETNGRVLAKAANPSSVAQCAVCRQTPKVGAECPKWACSDLCGGRSVMSVPTANAETPRADSVLRWVGGRGVFRHFRAWKPPVSTLRPPMGAAYD